ncbi:relaxase/mobilization nuclease [Streptomyces sp. NPDC056178]|uniref:relaxase/mobilization nuclease n=1 Tax=Streptomyces sp. NPDC056178 TaxID=3345735 RepID=UPI0035DA939F
MVAYWPGLDYYTLNNEQKIWTSATWAEHLDDPNWQYPFAAGEQDDRCAIWHVDVRLHPDDRPLTGPEWSEIAHRLARTVGIATPGDEQGCCWIAVQARPGRLDLLANLIRLDGGWQRQDAQLLRRLVAEARRIEADLQLRAPEEAHVQHTPGPKAASVAGQLAQVLFQITDERGGPLATVCGLVEHATQRLSDLPQSYGPETGNRLELAAARLHSLQQDLEHAAAGLAG